MNKYIYVNFHQNEKVSELIQNFVDDENIIVWEGARCHFKLGAKPAFQEYLTNQIERIMEFNNCLYDMEIEEKA